MDNVSDASFINDKRRTSTILMKPISRSKHLHHQKQEQTFILIDEENRLIPMQSYHRHHHRRRQLHIQAMRKELTQALDHIRYISSHCTHKALIESIRDEWKFIATVIDRLQFIVFSTITILGSFALLYQVSHIFFVDTDHSRKLVRFSNPNMTIRERVRADQT